MNDLIKISEDVYIGRSQLSMIRAITICPIVKQTMIKFTDGKLVYTHKIPTEVAEIIKKATDET